MNGILLAAPESGSGKTTVTAGIIAALTARGLTVQPFKVGPDYIDPTYHTLAAGRTCRNLDAWMLGKAAVRESYARNCRGADLAVVEGVMGLFDGFGVLDNEGSSAEIAHLLNLPIILVMSARGMARSAAAIVTGYDRFSAETRIAGVILNRVGSPRHAAMCQQAIVAETGVPVLGYMLRDETLVMPERHLGLVPTVEAGEWQAFIADVGRRVGETVDLDKLLGLAGLQNIGIPSDSTQEIENDGMNPSATSQKMSFSRRRQSTPQARIAIAQDEAFSFTYPENVELLQEAGAAIVPFSPLHDTAIPDDVDGIILVGGFPELYARKLGENRPMFDSIHSHFASNTPIYAECGGLMVLTDYIIDQQGDRHEMAGILGGYSRMTKRVKLGYRTVTALCDSPLLTKGTQVRGHEFHYSTWENRPKTLPYAYHIQSRTGGEPTPVGVQHGSVWASYIHLHFLTLPSMAQRFVAWCHDAR